MGTRNHQINGHPLTYKRVIWFLVGLVTAIIGVVSVFLRDNVAYFLLLYIGWMLAEIAWDNFIKQNKWSKAGGGSSSCGGSCGGGYGS